MKDPKLELPANWRWVRYEDPYHIFIYHTGSPMIGECKATQQDGEDGTAVKMMNNRQTRA